MIWVYSSVIESKCMEHRKLMKESIKTRSIITAVAVTSSRYSMFILMCKWKETPILPFMTRQYEIISIISIFAFSMEKKTPVIMCNSIFKSNETIQM